jgi:alpha-glucosidase
VAEADLATIPVYACGGAVVPLGPFLQYTDERPVDPLTLEVSPEPAGGPSGVLYEDGGHSFDYEQGGWRLTHYT